jgi:chromosome segregation ATPase
MIKDRLRQIQKRLKDAGGIPDEKREELVQLLADLDRDLETLQEAQAEHAESIAGFTERSAHEIARVERNPDLVDLSLKGLSRSVQGLEATHPKLVETVNAIFNMLSGIGV